MPESNTNGNGSPCHDSGNYCDNYDSYDCYDNDVENSCCRSCKENELNIKDCKYGDRVPDCDKYHSSICYNDDLRYNCCEMCFIEHTNITGCQYGDRVADCDYNKCGEYSSQERKDCCVSCHAYLPPTLPTETPTFSTTSHPSTPKTSLWNDVTSSTMSPVYPSTTDLTTTDGYTVTEHSSSADIPKWVVPVAGSAGGLIFLVILLLLFIFIRRRYNSGDHLSPIDDKMYNEYKLSKRPPMAVPRSSIDSRAPLTRQDSGEIYAYIDPRNVQSLPTNGNIKLSTRRDGSDPLPAIPDDKLSPAAPDTDKYGYFQPIADGEPTIFTVSGNNSQPTDNTNSQHTDSSAKRQNTYQKFPTEQQSTGDQRYANVNGERKL